MVRKINIPEFDKATRLTPLELNGIKLDDKHTLITPEMLDEAMKSRRGL